jgi:hypothetical protein
MAVTTISTILAAAALGAGPDVVVVDRDNVEIRTSCVVKVSGEQHIADADGNGVVHITGSNITIDFEETTLRGAAPDQAPDAYTGIAVRVTGTNVTLKNARISGYKGGIYATGADDLVIEDCDLSDNFRQRLKSTPQAEDPSDWLRPHANDNNEWLTNYGAAVYVEDSTRLTVRRIKVRNTQNGIILDRVSDAKVYDNDCSFLSGWGLAMWRSDRNVVCRNAFDFCVRGYSHGVYNRGQDSAGILMFEQCSDNVIAENSATHGGDGFFGFAGDEALGKVNTRAQDLEWYHRRGNNSNHLGGNDFSYAAAHGIEMTFSFGNAMLENRLVGNAICGIWGGYSHQTYILDNHLEANGRMGYGAERGGINIEHGRFNYIYGNTFKDNACGIYLWWDEDPHLLRLPWAFANEKGSDRNDLILNTIDGGNTGVQLRRTTSTRLLHNTIDNVDNKVDADHLSETTLISQGSYRVAKPPDKEPFYIGETRPAGARAALRGREHIIMTEWGPYDWKAPLLMQIEEAPRRHAYKMLGREALERFSLSAVEGVRLDQGEDPAVLIVSTDARGRLQPYTLTATTASGVQQAHAALAPLVWDVLVFDYETDPRTDADAWRAEGTAQGVGSIVHVLNLQYGTGGPSQLDLQPAVRDAGLPPDRFGTIATTTAVFPAGRWRLRTVSDDGIRVWLGGELVIDDWTWHPPKTHTHEFSHEHDLALELRVEHFELDGYAVLALEIEPLP